MNKYIKLIAYKSLMKKKMELAEPPKKEQVTQQSKTPISSWFDAPDVNNPVAPVNTTDVATIADRKVAVAQGKFAPKAAADIKDPYANDTGKMVYDVLLKNLHTAEKEQQETRHEYFKTVAENRKQKDRRYNGTTAIVSAPTNNNKNSKSKLAVAEEKVEAVKDSLNRFEYMIYTKQFGKEKYAADSSIDDVTYKYINNLDPKLKVKMNVGGQRRSTVADGELLDEMTPAEINVYNGVYKAFGKEKADSYLETLKTNEGGLSERYLGTVKKEATEFANESPVLAGGVSVYNNVLDGALGVAKPFVDKKEAPQLYAVGEQSATIRQTQRENIDSPVLKVAYDVGMGIADMGASLAIGYAIGGTGAFANGAKAAKTITGVVMASSAGSSAMSEARDRGYSDLQVAAVGISSAAIEMLTERFSIEALFKAPTGAIKYLVQNFVTEGAEEMTSDVCNTIVDTMIGGDKSELITQYNELIKNGKSEKEAAQILWKEKVSSVLYSGLVGSLTGLGMGSFGATSYSVKNNIANKSVGRQVNKKSQNGIGGLITAASVDFSSKGTKKYAQRLQNKISNGKAVTEFQTGKLYRMLSTDVGKYVDNAKNSADLYTAAKTLNDVMVQNGLAPVMYNQVQTSLMQKNTELNKLPQKEIPEWKKTPYYTALVGEAKAEAYTDTEIEAAEETRKAEAEKVLSFVAEACEVFENSNAGGKGIDTAEAESVDISSAQVEAAKDKAESMLDDDFDMERGYQQIPDRIIDDEGYVIGEADSVNAPQEQHIMPMREQGTDYSVNSENINDAHVDSNDIGNTNRIGGVIPGAIVDEANLNAEQREAIETAKTRGITVKFFNPLPSFSNFNGFCAKDGTVYISTTANVPAETVIHEFTHYGERNTEKYKKYRKAVLKSKMFKTWIMQEVTGAVDVDAAIEAKCNEYIDAATELNQIHGEEILDTSPETAEREVIAQFSESTLFRESGIEALKNDNGIIAAEKRTIVDYIKAALKWIASRFGEHNRMFAKKKSELLKLERLYSQMLEGEGSAQESNISFSTETFPKQVDAVLGGMDTQSTHLKISENTPQILLDIGLSDKPMLITSAHTKTAVGVNVKGKNVHSISKDIFKTLPELIKKPAIIMESTIKDRVVMFVNAVDTNNYPILCAIEIYGKGYFNNIEINANVIASIYGKDTNPIGFIKKAVDENRLLYWDKKMSQELFDIPGLQLPNNINNLDSNVIIRKITENVKGNNSKGSASVDFAASKGISIEEAVETEDYIAPAEQNADTNSEQATEPIKETYTAEEFKKAIAEAERRGEARARGLEQQKQKVKSENKKISDRKRTLINEVMRRSKWLADKLLTNNNLKHIPEGLKEVVAQFLLHIDYSSARKLKGGADTKSDVSFQWIANEVITNLEKYVMTDDGNNGLNGNLDIDPEILEKMRQIQSEANSKFKDSDSKEVLRNLSNEQLETLNDFVKNLYTAIKQINETYVNNFKKNADELGKAGLDDFKKFKQRRQKDGFIRKWNWNLELPIYAFERMGKVTKSIFEGFMDGADKLAKLVAAAENYLDSVFQEHDVTSKDVRDWENTKHNITLGPMAQEFTLTEAQMMDLYNLSKREQARSHMTLEKYYDGSAGQGIVVGEFEANKEKVTKNGKDKKVKKQKMRVSEASGTLSESDINKICNMLSDKQRAVADAMFNYMPECAKWGNEIYMRRFGIERFKETDYWPIEVAAAFKDVNVDRDSKNLYALANASFTKNTVDHAKNPIMVRSVFEVYSHHVAEMARYNAFTLPLLDAIRWLNYKESLLVTDAEGESKESAESLRNELGSAHGDGAFKYIYNFLQDINGDTQKTNIVEGTLLKLTKRAKIAAVGNNLRVALLQPTSYMRASQELSYAALMHGLKKSNVKAAKKHSGIVLWKTMGYYDTDVTRSIEQKLHGNATAIDKVTEASLALAGKADELTLGWLWTACEYDISRKYPKLEKGSEEFNKAVAELLRTVVYKTQVVDSVLTRSTVMREKSGMVRNVTAFMSEPILSYNQLMNAWHSYSNDVSKGMSRTEAFKKNKNLILNNIASYMFTSLTTALVESLFDALRDEEDEKLWKKYLDALLGIDGNLLNNLNPFEKIPFFNDLLGEITSLGTSLVKGKSLYNYSSPELYDSGITNAITAIGDIYRLCTGKSQKQPYAVVYNAVQSFSQLTGLPISNALREVVTVWNNTAGAADPELILRRKKISNSTYYEKIYDAIGDKTEFQAQMDKAYGVGLTRSQIITSIKNQMQEDKELQPKLEKANDVLEKRNAAEKNSAEWEQLDDEYQNLLFELVSEGFPEDAVLKAVEGYKTKDEKKAEKEINKKVEKKAESLIDQCMQRIYESAACKDLNTEQKAEVEQKVKSYAYAVTKADFDKACELSLQHKKVKAAESVGIDPVKFYALMAEAHGNTKAAKRTVVNNSELSDSKKADMHVIINATSKNIDYISESIKED